MLTSSLSLVTTTALLPAASRSNSIIVGDPPRRYLWEKYGDGAGNVPLMLRMGILTTLSVGIGLMARMGKGSMYEPSRMPKEPLVR